MDFGLSSPQLAVICALSSGASITAAAEQAGVHRNTISNWRRNDLSFQEAFACAQHDRALFFREKIAALADLALQCLQRLLTDPDTPASVRLKAALAIVQTATAPPEPDKPVAHVETTRTVTEDQPESAPVVHKDAQCTPPAAVGETGPVTEAPDSRPVHNAAQQPIRRVHPKIGRNQTCPCGSGKKYKRCCLDQPMSQDHAAAGD